MCTAYTSVANTGMFYAHTQRGYNRWKFSKYQKDRVDTLSWKPTKKGCMYFFWKSTAYLTFFSELEILQTMVPMHKTQ